VADSTLSTFETVDRTPCRPMICEILNSSHMWRSIGARTVRAGHVLIVHSVWLKRRETLAINCSYSNYIATQ